MKHNARPRDVRAVPSHNGLQTANEAPDHAYARIAELAYSFYEQRGRQDGYDVEDWIQAEQAILEDSASRQNRSKAREKVRRGMDGDEKSQRR